MILELTSHLPTGWGRARLKHTIDSIRAGTWGSEPTGQFDTLVVRVADFRRSSLTVSEDFSTLRSVSKSEIRDRRLRQGDLLIEKSGGGDNNPAGFVVQFTCSPEEPVVPSNFIARIRVRPGFVARYWLYVHYALYSNGLTSRSIKQTTGIQNLDLKMYLDEVVPLPPVQVQKSIADFLDCETAQIDKLIEKQEKLIEKLQERLNADIHLAVTQGVPSARPDATVRVPSVGDAASEWRFVQLRRLGKPYSGSGFPHEFQGRTDLDIPFLKVKSLAQADERGYINHGDDTVDIETAKELSATVFPPDTIVYAKVGAALLLGRMRILGTSACLDNNMSGFILSGKTALPRFLYYAMSRLPFEAFVNPGAVPSLAERHMASHPVPLPTIEEQQEIVEYLDSQVERTQELIDKAQRFIALLKERRAALITAAVTGQIDVREKMRERETVGG